MRLGLKCIISITSITTIPHRGAKVSLTSIRVSDRQWVRAIFEDFLEFALCETVTTGTAVGLSFTHAVWTSGNDSGPIRKPWFLDTKRINAFRQRIFGPQRFKTRLGNQSAI